MPTGGLMRQGGTVLGGLHRLLDIGLIFLALFFATQLHDVAWGEAHSTGVAWAAVLFLLVAEVKRLYGSYRTRGLWDEIGPVFWVCAGVFLGLVAIAFASKTSADYARLVIGSWFVLILLFLSAQRLLLRLVLWYLRKRGFNSRTAAIVGATPLGLQLWDSIDNESWTGLRVLGLYDERKPDRLPQDLNPDSVLGKLTDLLRDVHAGKIDYVYIALPQTAKKRIVDLVNALADTTASVYVVPDLFLTDLAQARWYSLGHVPVVSVFESPFFGVDGWLKQAEDVILGTLILAVIAVPMVLIAVGIKFTSPGPVFFRQRRYGLNGKVVEVWKFRSMTVQQDGDKVPQAHRNDLRVTRFGAFLRQTSLDELPQFFNVLIGEMSIVGPRPHAVAHNEQYRRLIHGYMLRHKVKPGIWSLWLDIKIIWLTILRGFTGKNVY